MGIDTVSLIAHNLLQCFLTVTDCICQDAKQCLQCTELLSAFTLIELCSQSLYYRIFLMYQNISHNPPVSSGLEALNWKETFTIYECVCVCVVRCIVIPYVYQTQFSFTIRSGRSYLLSGRISTHTYVYVCLCVKRNDTICT